LPQGASSADGVAADQPKTYVAPVELGLNQSALQGTWLVAEDHATLQGAGGSVLFRFYARDLHLVLGAAANGHPVHFRVLLDGFAPAADHGIDTDAQGYGSIDGQRLYQLLRQSKPVGAHTFSIQFLDDGAQSTHSHLARPVLRHCICPTNNVPMGTDCVTIRRQHARCRRKQFDGSC
jgi:hypothetical protein